MLALSSFLFLFDWGKCFVVGVPWHEQSKIDWDGRCWALAWQCGMQEDQVSMGHGWPTAPHAVRLHLGAAWCIMHATVFSLLEGKDSMWWMRVVDVEPKGSALCVGPWNSIYVSLLMPHALPKGYTLCQKKNCNPLLNLQASTPPNES
jgi:hypothetical protein